MTILLKKITDMYKDIDGNWKYPIDPVHTLNRSYVLSQCGAHN